MKPRIYKTRGLWYCAKPHTGPRGVGYTPAEAYADWWQLMRKKWLEAA